MGGWCGCRPGVPRVAGDVMFAELGYWYATTQCDPRVVDLYSRHYSATKNRKGRADWLSAGVAGPGEKMVLMTSDSRALFVWRKVMYRRDGQHGVECAVFRNESPLLSSDLIREAVVLALRRWPHQRLFTYVNARKVRSSNPGYCFKMAGWRVAGRSSTGLILLEYDPLRWSLMAQGAGL